METKKIKVVMVRPDEFAKVEEIEANLSNYQTIVGGMIEAAYPFEDKVCIVCNEEGKLSGLPLNRALYEDDDYENDDKLYDIIAGTFFICDCSGESFGSLSDEMAEKYLKRFEYPEGFVKTTQGIAVLRDD